MLDNFVKFLKDTFTYAEESTVKTPETVSSSAPKQPQKQTAQGSTHNRPAPQQTAVRPAAQPRKQTVVGESDPQKAAQQQTDNFNALRPKPGDNPYRMIVDKVFYAKGSGVVVRGTLAQGVARVGAQSLIVHAANKTTVRTKIIGIERNGQLVNSAPAGSTVGLLLDRLTRNDVHSGDVIGEIF